MQRNYLLLALCLVVVLVLSINALASECGGDHERACCFLENTSIGTCQAGLTTVAGCPAQDSQFQGDCTCAGGAANATQSCEANISHCGNDGERACCAGEGVACNGDLHQQTVDGCTGDNCYCSSGALSAGTCFSPTSCGGVGQRACCNGDAEFSNNGLACNSGLVQVPGCDSSTGSCYCPSGHFKSGGTCVQPTECGGKGERACCVGTLEHANDGDTSICNSGLIAVNGCAGDCTCGGTTSIGESSTQTCTVIESIIEPAINGTPEAGLPSGPECPAPPALCGYADLHVHMFAHLAHGGGTLAGAPYNPTGGVNTALGEDYGSSNVLVKNSGKLVNKVDGSDGTPQCPDYMINSPIGNLCSGQYLFHGDHTPFDTTTYGGTNDASASNFGAPSFNGWPQWTSTIHQQVYYKWLERAWRGGLRLMVMPAVTNEALCKTSFRIQKYDGSHNTDCTNSMVEIDAQINAAKAFQTWLDSQSGGPGQGWFQIVTSPQQATDVIQHGKLAVILGIEVENLFNCHFGADTGTAKEGTVYPFEPTTDPPSTLISCTPQFVQDQVQHYYDMGVRHIFPIHNFDNAYGGPAAWQDSINVGNEIGEGEYWDTENCYADNYGFWLDAGAENFQVGVLNLLGFSLDPVPAYTASTPSSPFATCNKKGLTALGQTLMNSLMDKGMIIDIDHMSRHSLDATLSIAVNRSYPGIAATHVQFFDLYNQIYSDNFGRHERMRTKSQLRQIKDLGGLISVMLKDDVQDTSKGFCLPNAVCFAGAGSLGGKYTVEYNGPSNNYGLKNNCRYSTTEWAQAYMYGADTMGGPVTMGSDFNGVAGHVGPRFGSAACGGDPTERSAQERAQRRLVYPFTIPGFGTFDMQVSGQRKFDFNTSGLAHIGLLPDMVADLKNVGLTDQQLTPLFSGAQAYIDMWSKVSPPIASKFVVSAPATALKGASFQVVVTAEDTNGNKATGYTGTVQITSSDGAANLPPNAMLTSGSGTFTVTLNTGGNQTITATDTTISSITGTSDPITVQQSPTITSADHATFTTGIQGLFTMTATGFPTSFTFGESGALPSGVSFSQLFGKLFGTPDAGTGGVYPIILTASNGVLPDAHQNFTLTVNQPPAITSANGATFSVGVQGSFTVTSTGFPTPALSEQGTLPGGVGFTDNQNGSGTLAGIPCAGGSFPLTFKAANNVLPNATQNFTLLVNKAATTVSIAVTTGQVRSGRPVTFIATVVPAGGCAVAGSQGSVQFIDVLHNLVLGTVPLTSGRASFTTVVTRSLDVKAVYVGNASFTGAQSRNITVFVERSGH